MIIFTSKRGGFRIRADQLQHDPVETLIEVMERDGADFEAEWESEAGGGSEEERLQNSSWSDRIAKVREDIKTLGSFATLRLLKLERDTLKKINTHEPASTVD